MHEIAKSGGLGGSENLSPWQHKLYTWTEIKKRNLIRIKTHRVLCFVFQVAVKIILTMHACSALMDRISIFVMIQNTPKATEDVQGTGLGLRDK